MLMLAADDDPATDCVIETTRTYTLLVLCFVITID